MLPQALPSPEGLEDRRRDRVSREREIGGLGKTVTERKRRERESAHASLCVDVNVSIVILSYSLST